MSENNAEVRLGAETSELNSKMAQAAATVEASLDKMKASFESMNTVMGKFNSVFAAVTAVLGGGAAFSHAISETIAFTAETDRMSKMLGIARDEAAALSMALQMIGSNTETYSGVIQKMTMKLREGEDRFNELGVATRDSNGHFLDSEEILQNTLNALTQFKAGTDRNLASTELLGRNWAEASKLMRLASIDMDEIKKKQAELNLVVGDENVTAMRAYRTAMAEAHEVVEAMEVAIGRALMPVLTDLATWFAENGPTAVRIMQGVIVAVEATFIGFKMAAQITWEALKAGIQQTAVLFLTFADVVDHALHLDFSGAKEAWNRGMGQISDIGEEWMKKTVADAEKNRDDLFKLLSDFETGPKKPESTSPVDPDGKEYVGKPKPPAADSRFSEMKSDLEATKDEEGSFFKDSLVMEEQFWSEKLSMVGTETKQDLALRRQIGHEIYSIHKQLAQQALAEDIQDLKQQQALARENGTERIRIAGEIAARVGEAYGTEDAKYKAAVVDMTKAAEDRGKELKRIDDEILAARRDHDLALIDIDAERLNMQKQTGEIGGAEELQGLQKLEAQKYIIQRQALQQRLAILDQESEEYQKVLNELAKLNDAHNLTVLKSNNAVVLETGKKWDQLFGAVESAMANSAKGIAMGTQTMRQAMMGVGEAVLGEFTSLGVKMGAAWIKTQAGLTLTSEEGAAQRLAIESWAALKSVGIASWEAIKKIAIKSWETFANVYAAVSEIPYGWIVAPVLAGAAAAAVMVGVSNIGSAAGGWEVPSDQLAMVHKNEHVLPASIAQRYSDGAPGANGLGGQAMSGNRDVHVHFNVSANDARGVERFFADNSEHIAKAVHTEIRNFSKYTRK